MCLTCLSNKNSPAPVAYLGLHFSLLAGVAYCCPSIISFHDHPEVFIFWLDTIITLALYFATHLRNPGYVEQDELYFTERPYPAIKSSTPMKRTNDSLALNHGNNKKSAGKSKKKNITAELEMEMRISNLNKNYMKKIQEPDHGASSVSTNSVMITNIPTEILQHSDKKPGVDDQSIYGNQGINYQEEQSKSVIKDVKNDEDMVDCEPSMDVGEESMHEPHGINFDVKSNDDIDALDGSRTPGKNYPLNQENKNNQIKQEIFEGSRKDEQAENRMHEERQEEVSDQDRTRELHFEQQNMCNELKKQRIKNENSHKPPNTDKSDENADEVIKKKTNFYKFNEGSLTVPHSSGTTPHMTFSAAEVSSPLARHLDQNQEYELMKSTERRLISRTETDNTYIEEEKKEKNKKKKKDGNKKNKKKDQKKEIKLVARKLDEAPEMEDLEKQQEVKEEEILYVERRYCTKCGLEQPIRAKHCKECERCVSQYDHHCPWLGNCIGERNHNLFYWYLIFQLVEALWGEFKVFEYMFTITYHDWASENAGRITLAVILAFFIIMILSLLCFHTYLACVNLTTWESLSWYKISYLREWHEDWGSPFSEGAVKNLKFFCCSSKAELRRWEMPKYKRPLEDQEASQEP